jgi:hypothetical protein
VQPLPEGRARDLVAVDPQDPIAGALAVKPSQRPFDRRRKWQADHAVRKSGMCRSEVRINACVDGDHHFVSERAQRRDRGRNQI